MAGNPGRPKGSENKDKPYRDALRMELAEAANDFRSLRAIARAHIAAAANGDMSAIKELADRLDGKPAQAIEHTGDTEPRYVAIMPATMTSEEWKRAYIEEDKQNQSDTSH